MLNRLKSLSLAEGLLLAGGLAVTIGVAVTLLVYVVNSAEQRAAYQRVHEETDAAVKLLAFGGKPLSPAERAQIQSANIRSKDELERLDDLNVETVRGAVRVGGVSGLAVFVLVIAWIRFQRGG